MDRNPWIGGVRVGLAVIVAGSVLGLATPAAAGEVKPQKKWLAMRTPGFSLLGDVGERDLRRVAQRLEQFREALGILLPRAVQAGSAPTTVLVFRSHRNFEPFKPMYGDRVKDIAGFFLPGRTVNYITLTTQGGLGNVSIVYHEYLHLLVSNTLGDVPTWLDEGLAEFYRTFEASGDGERAYLGRLNQPHVLLLREKFVPLDQLTAVDHDSPLYNERDRASVFYAQSWALVHYLQLGNEQKYAPKFGEFITAIVKGMPFADACSGVLGVSSQDLEQELRNYVRRNVFVSRRVEFAERIARLKQVSGTPVPDVQVHATLGDLLLQMGRTEDARAQLEHAIGIDPSYSPAHASLGLLHMREDRLDEARAHLKQALEGHGGTYLTSYYYAQALANPGFAGEEGQDDARQEAIESALRRTIELNPAFPDGYAQLSWHRQQAGAVDDAMALLRKAISLAPARREYLFNYATLLVTAGNSGDARTVLEHVRRTAPNEALRAAAVSQLERLAAYERARAAAAAGGAGFDAASRPGAGPSASSNGVIPMLRDLQPGENRVAARMRRIDCERDHPVLVLEVAEAGLLRLRAASLSQVEFITYRDDLTGGITCGPHQGPGMVFVTYRPDQTDDIAGQAVAVEFLPDGYTP